MIYWAGDLTGDGIPLYSIFERMPFEQLKKIVIDDETGKVRISMRGTEAAAVYLSRLQERRKVVINNHGEC